MIILMIKLLLLMLPKLNPTSKRQKQSYSWSKRTRSKHTSNIKQETKNYQ
ncbi:hypothetical protein [Spiroplasma poulsonii]|nr:hypothetical protein [Spiroplasma poulsonii]UNF62094.1 hypothetical protein MNU24_01110 [Spiroplasma poulsonii]